MILKQLNRSKRCNKVIRANATMCKNFKYFNQVLLQSKLLEVSLTLKINAKTSLQKPKTSFNDEMCQWHYSTRGGIRFLTLAAKTVSSRSTRVGVS